MDEQHKYSIYDSTNSSSSSSSRNDDDNDDNKGVIRFAVTATTDTPVDADADDITVIVYQLFFDFTMKTNMKEYNERIQQMD